MDKFLYLVIVSVVFFQCGFYKKEVVEYVNSEESGPIIFDKNRSYNYKFSTSDSMQLDYMITKTDLSGSSYYFIDGIGQTILNMDLHRNFQISKFSGSKGAGPEEFGNIINLDVFGEHLYVFDRVNRKFHKLNQEGGFEITHKMDLDFNHVGHWKDEIFVANESNKNSLDFYTVDIQNQQYKKIKHLSNLYQETDFPDFLYDGIFIRSTDSKSVLYFMYYNQAFIKFNEDSLQYLSKVIYKIPEPTIISDGGTTMIKGNNVVSIIDIDINNGMIYVLSGILSKEFSQQMVIDIYDELNGKYLGSCLVPQLYRYGFNHWAQHLSVNNSQVFILYEESILKIGTIKREPTI